MGLFWYIVCDLKEFISPEEINFISYNYGEACNKEEIGCVEADGVKGNYHRVVASMYYAFTSLSTVGFGDLHPENNFERGFCAFILLAGNAIFGYVLGVFREMVQESQDSDENDDTEALNRFFSMICKFNGGRPINTMLKEKLEKYFEYRWAHDRNFALGINNEQDREMLEQLPEDVQIKIYKFLFSEFLFKFRDFFTFFKFGSKEIGHVRKFRTDLITWQDTEYQEFMIKIMKHLEPRHNLW